MKLKHSVKINCIQPEVLVGHMIVDSVMSKHGVEAIWTSVNDSKHGKNSLHPEGLAIDYRSKHIDIPSLKRKILKECQEALGPNFDFILEGLGTDNEHYHLEYDPD